MSAVLGLFPRAARTACDAPDTDIPMPGRRNAQRDVAGVTVVRHTDGCTSQIVEFDGPGPYAGLLYHSPHTVLHEGELYPTGLHLFEVHKSLDRRPGVVRRIRECERVEEVTAISGEMRAFTRPD